MSSQIHDLGYRKYTGERAGVSWAVRSLKTHSVRRALGIKRSGRHKIAPVMTIGLAYLPALGLAAAAIFLGSDLASDLIGYGDYYGIIAFALLLFTAAVVPGVLTSDRTTGMLALYLASPLTRSTYVLAKAVGIFQVMLLVTTGPVLFLAVAYRLADADGGSIGSFLEILLRGLVAGVLAAAFWTCFGMLIASFPKRWGIASVSIVATAFITNFAVAVLAEETDAGAWVAFFAPGLVVSEAWQRIFVDPVVELDAIDGQGTGLVIFVAIAYVVALAGGTWWRYQTVEIDR